jgi:ABC-type amino acid transport substrate-binding protein
MRSRKLVWLGAAVLVVGISACNGPLLKNASGGGSGGGGAGSSTLKFTKNGTPDLRGMTIRIGNAAGSAHIGDTNVHDLVQFLTEWGATASQENASQNAPELAVDSGKLDVAIGPLPTEVDAGLAVFGPNQARLDDEILASPSITSLSGLKGKTVAICCDASPDGVLMSAALQKGGLSQGQLSIVRTGASASSLNALLSGRVDAAFTAASGLPPAAGKYRVLGTATQLVPSYADSFMAAQSSWLKSNAAAAEAVDLAWLASAKLCGSNEAAWVKNAASYTSNADSASQYSQAWQQLNTLAGWPLSESTLTPSIVSYNLSIAKQQNALQGQGTRPASQEMDLTPWQKAWSQFSQHQGAY